MRNSIFIFTDSTFCMICIQLRFTIPCDGWAIGSAEDLPPRFRAETRGLRPDPANFRQNYFSADSAERPANVRRTPGGSARTPPRTGGRVHSKNVRRQKLILHLCSLRKNFRGGRPSAAEILIGSGLGLGLRLWLRLGLRLGLGLEDPNPDPTIISAAEGRPRRKFFRGEPWCKVGFCRQIFFE